MLGNMDCKGVLGARRLERKVALRAPSVGFQADQHLVVDSEELPGAVPFLLPQERFADRHVFVASERLLAKRIEQPAELDVVVEQGSSLGLNGHFSDPTAA